MRKTWQKPLLFVLLLVLPLSAAQANSAPRSDWTYFGFQIENMPSDAVYLDVLLPMDETVEDYTACNMALIESSGLSADCDLVTYAEGNAAFVTAHWTEAVSFETVKEGRTCHFDYAQWERFDPDTDFYAMRVGLFDAEGRLILLSAPAQRHKGVLGFLTRGNAVLVLDAATGELREGGEFNLNIITVPAWTVILVGLIVVQAIVPLAVTLMSEIVLGLMFGFPALSVMAVNIITNPILCLLMFVLVSMCGLPYGWILFILELLVLLAEYLLYHRAALRTAEKKRLAIYVVCANVLSFVCGMLLWTVQKNLGLTFLNL